MHLDLDTFALERWMTAWETVVRYDIAESGIYPLSLAELYDLIEGNAAERLERAIRETPLGYSEARGTEALRTTLAATYARATSEDILVTTGAIEANFLLFNVLLKPGDHVVAVSPAYQQLHSVPKAIGCDVDFWDVRGSKGAAPGYDLDQLEALHRPDTRLIVINSPHNPTGAMLDEAQLHRVIELADRSGAWILSDEAYRWLEHPGGEPLPPPVHDLTERGISVGTLSKPFGLPGLRLGWFITNQEIARAAWSMRDFVSLSPSKISDLVAQTAIEQRERIFPRHARIIGTNLETARTWFNKHADLASWNEPRAGLLAMLRYSIEKLSSDLADSLAEHASVMLAPGSTFGMEGHLRIGIGQRPNLFAEGLSRTAKHLEQLRFGRVI